MKKYLLLTFLCTCAALCGAAGVRNDVSSHLEKAKMSLSQVKRSPATLSHDACKPLQTYLRDRYLSQNRLGRKSSLRDLSSSDFTGTRIAAMEIHDYQEDGSVDSAYTNVGWAVQLNHWYDEEEEIYDGVFYMTDYSDFYTVMSSTIPFAIDYESQQAYLFYYEIIFYGLYETIGNELFEKYHSVYLLPEEFLYDETGEEWPDCIEGAVYDDGTVTFEGGFVYYTVDIYDKYNASNNILISSDTVYSVSPVYRNLCLLVPNGMHNFKTLIQSYINYDLVSQEETQLISSTRVMARDPGGVYGTSGYGGSIGTPIDPRPIKPGTLWSGNGTTPERSQPPVTNDRGRRTRFSLGFVTDSVPVYMYQTDDGTLKVYNLYGSGLVENYMLLYKNGTMSFPGQQIDFDDESSAGIFNCTGRYSDTLTRWGLSLGNVGLAAPDSVTWGETLPYTLNGLIDHKYEDNKLYFTDDEQFVLPPFTPGDVNNDDDISILDVVLLIDRLLSGNTNYSDDFNSIAADYNQDGEISVLDVSLMIDQLLSNKR